jgi:hypothetical protein
VWRRRRGRDGGDCPPLCLAWLAVPLAKLPPSKRRKNLIQQDGENCQQKILAAEYRSLECRRDRSVNASADGPARWERLAKVKGSAGLGRVNRELIGKAEAFDVHGRAVLDMDSTVRRPLKLSTLQTRLTVACRGG